MECHFNCNLIKATQIDKTLKKTIFINLATNRKTWRFSQITMDIDFSALKMDGLLPSVTMVKVTDVGYSSSLV